MMDPGGHGPRSAALASHSRSLVSTACYSATARSDDGPDSGRGDAAIRVAPRRQTGRGGAGRAFGPLAHSLARAEPNARVPIGRRVEPWTCASPAEPAGGARRQGRAEPGGGASAHHFGARARARAGHDSGARGLFALAGSPLASSANNGPLALRPALGAPPRPARGPPRGPR